MLTIPKRVLLVLVLVCTGGCYTAPTLDPLDYLPTLGYLRNVLRLSSYSLAEVQRKTKLPLPDTVHQALNSVRNSLDDAHRATGKITEQLHAQGTTLQTQQLSEALYKIYNSLCESDFHLPDYYRKEDVSLEMDQLKQTMREHLQRVVFNKDVLEFGDLREINSFLAGATSQAMSATAAVHTIFSVEKLDYYLQSLFFPPYMETTALQELQDIGVLVRSYDQLYGVALGSAAKRFLDQTTEERQLLQTVLGTGTALPERVKGAVEEFSNQVDHFIQTAFLDLQTTKRKSNDRFGEVVQKIQYTSYGLLSSGMGMLRPFVQHYPCLLDMVPRTQTTAGASLGSVALCSNEATTPLYDVTMVYREKILQLQRNVLEGLQQAVLCKDDDENCASVYSETVNLIKVNTDAVREFKVDFGPYMEQLLSCLTSRYEKQMIKVLHMSVSFDQCVKTTS